MGAIARVLFWRYSRGSWQYDILCIVILLFIFLTPPSIFDTRLQNGAAAADESESVERPHSPQSPAAPDEVDAARQPSGGGQSAETSQSR